MNDWQKEEIKNRLVDYLLAIGGWRDKRSGKDLYYCPLCKSGSGEDGAFHVTGKLWHCFSCEKGGDIFSLAGFFIKSNNFNEKVNEVCQRLGIIEQPRERTGERKVMKEQQPTPPTEERKQPIVDYTAFLNACAANGAEYFKSRGLSEETIKRFRLGTITATTQADYTAVLQTAKAFRVGDVTIPYFDETGKIIYFIARATNVEPNSKSTLPKFKKPPTEQAGSEPAYITFNIKNTNEPIFFTEAQIDALSIIEAGGKAVAVGGTGIDKLAKASNNFFELLKKSGLPVVLAFDNDEPGRKATSQAIEFLKANGVRYSLFPHAKGCKDINDFLITNKTELAELIKKIKQKFEREQLQRIAHTIPTGELLDGIMDEIKANNESEIVSTGFKGIDEIFNGGLRPGFYVVGAISSLGKTALTLQIADNVAASGRDVIFFSLEMARKELVARSLSRRTYEYALSHEASYIDGRAVIPKSGMTTASILLGKLVNKEQHNALEYSKLMYKQSIGQNMFIVEGVGNVGHAEIRSMVEAHTNQRGKAPVVIVDYIQLLGIADESQAGDKQKIDKAVMELKRLSRDFNIPVVGISSLNRMSYNEPMGMAAYKESGIIEYTADVLIGLNFKDLETEEAEAIELPNGQKKKPKKKDPLTVRNENDNKKKAGQAIEITFRVLKNRNGLTGKTELLFVSMFNHFEDAPKKKEKQIPFFEKLDREAAARARLNKFADAFGGTVYEMTEEEQEERQELAELFATGKNFCVSVGVGGKREIKIEE